MQGFTKKYQPYLPAVFFVGGFIFDLLTATRIDQSFSLIQQIVYILLLMLFVYWEVVKPKALTEGLGRFMWRFHVEILHFLFGSLLSLYTIFYFKSASLLTSFIFLGILTVILIVNEMPQFHGLGLPMRFAMLALCMTSYAIYIVPVVSGSIGLFSFGLSIVLSMSLFMWLVLRLEKKGIDRDEVIHTALLPGLIVNCVFTALFLMKMLPPVPVSLKEIGIYHKIEKKQGSFYLYYERDWWRFWENGAQKFVRREGDAIHCFVSIFSPTNFKDKMKLEWFRKNNKGNWKRWDAIPLPIVGGRDNGYRGYAYKQKFDLGSWQVRVVTSDQREVGRIYFDVIDAEPGTEREYRVDIL